jgi:hypothetical protein
MTKLPKKQKHYIDIRLHLDKEVEDFGDGDVYEYFHIKGVERIKIKGIEEDQLDSLGETVAQSDHYQIYLFGAVSNAIDIEGIHEL